MPNEESTYLEWNGQLSIDFSGMNQFLVNVDFNCVFVKDDIVMDQFIIPPKPYKIVSSETMMDRLISLTKCSTDEVP